MILDSVKIPPVMFLKVEIGAMRGEKGAVAIALSNVVLWLSFGKIVSWD
ncbi:hypothetical protein H6F96_17450 [Microcoleus sp. FACHB-53]|nr:hypothetical protein [Microcoleus sp. FACHB-53]